MNIVIISCSHRQNSQSKRIAGDLSLRLAALDSSMDLEVIELLPETLPLWSPEVFADPELSQKWSLLAGKLQKSSAIILVVPEWGGMAPPAIKNLLLFASQKELGHKPCLLCTISSSRGGAFPISELRASGYKNNRLLFLPDHLIIRECESQNLNLEPVSEDDRYLKHRIDRTLAMLVEYATVFRPMRASKLFTDFMKDYPNGMS